VNAPERITLEIDNTPGPAGAASARDHALAAALLGAALAYATVRYNVLKGVPWSDWPGYIVNKALAVAGLWLLAWSAWRKLAGRRSTRVPMGWAGCLILSHVLVSLGLFGSVVFPKYFADGKVNLVGGASLLAGALAVTLLEIGARCASAWPRRTWLRTLAAVIALSALHTALPGFAGWFVPREWPGSLPPLTLLACAPAAAIAVSVAWARHWPGEKAHLRGNAKPSAGDRLGTVTTPSLTGSFGLQRTTKGG